MEAPKCKLCGQRHYGLCSKGGDATGTPAQSPIPRHDKPPAVSTKPAAGGTWEEPKVWVGPTTKPRFDRTAYHRAYMKEYMRKRRAKAKEDK